MSDAAARVAFPGHRSGQLRDGLGLKTLFQHGARLLPERVDGARCRIRALRKAHKTMAKQSGSVRRPDDVVQRYLRSRASQRDPPQPAALGHEPGSPKEGHHLRDRGDSHPRLGREGVGISNRARATLRGNREPLHDLEGIPAVARIEGAPEQVSDTQPFTPSPPPGHARNVSTLDRETMFLAPILDWDWGIYIILLRLPRGKNPDWISGAVA